MIKLSIKLILISLFCNYSRPTVLCQSQDYTITENNGSYSVYYKGSIKKYISGASNQIPNKVIDALNKCQQQNN